MMSYMGGTGAATGNSSDAYERFYCALCVRCCAAALLSRKRKA
jgi:hypothetical protein